jgi:hypothetical protein
MPRITRSHPWSVRARSAFASLQGATMREEANKKMKPVAEEVSSFGRVLLGSEAGMKWCDSAPFSSLYVLLVRIGSTTLQNAVVAVRATTPRVRAQGSRS